MTRKTVSLEIDPAHEPLLRQYANYLEEMDHLAATTPHGGVLDTCEEAVIEKGRKQQRLVLQRAVQARLDLAEQKGRRRGSGHADRPARTVEWPPARSSLAWAGSG